MIVRFKAPHRKHYESCRLQCQQDGLRLSERGSWPSGTEIRTGRANSSIHFWTLRSVMRR
jgi:hypothetical protein